MAKIYLCFEISGLPDFCNTVLAKCLKMGYINHKPDQLTINQYEPGQGMYLDSISFLPDLPSSDFQAL